MVLKVLGLAVVAVSLLTTGCGGGGGPGRPDLTPVSGTVLYNGKPIAGATVTFWHEKAPRPASGITDAEGKYSLMMFEPGDGAMDGENTITVSKAGAKAATTMSPAEMAKDGALNMAKMSQQSLTEAPVKPEIPEKYASKSTSTLKENVSTSNNVIPLQLAD